MELTRNNRLTASPRCPYCHDLIRHSDPDIALCHTCFAPSHVDCWTELSCCSSCRGTDFVATPASAVSQFSDQSFQLDKTTAKMPERQATDFFKLGHDYYFHEADLNALRSQFQARDIIAWPTIQKRQSNSSLENLAQNLLNNLTATEKLNRLLTGLVQSYFLAMMIAIFLLFDNSQLISAGIKHWKSILLFASQIVLGSIFFHAYRYRQFKNTFLPQFRTALSTRDSLENLQTIASHDYQLNMNCLVARIVDVGTATANIHWQETFTTNSATAHIPRLNQQLTLQFFPQQWIPTFFKKVESTAENQKTNTQLLYSVNLLSEKTRKYKEGEIIVLFISGRVVVAHDLFKAHKEPKSGPRLD